MARAPGGKPERRAGMTMRGPKLVQRCETQPDDDLSLSGTLVLKPADKGEYESKV